MMNEIYLTNNEINTTFIYVIGSLIAVFLFLIALFLLIIMIKNCPCNKKEIHQRYQRKEDYVETETENSCSR